MAMIYRMAIEGIPSGFVAMACRRFIQGQVEGASLEFRPSPAKLAAECRRLRDKALDRERLAALRLPKPEATDPPNPTPEERERAAARWAEARAEIAEAVTASNIPMRTPKRPTRRSHIEPAVRSPIDLSDFPDANASHAELKAWDERQQDATQ